MLTDRQAQPLAAVVAILQILLIFEMSNLWMTVHRFVYCLLLFWSSERLIIVIPIASIIDLFR